jgi:uncharacterized RDD family membrane protein YckC
MNTGAELEYVGFWARAVATLIDLLLLFAAAAPFFLGSHDVDYVDHFEVLARPAEFLVSFLLPATVVIGFWSMRNATPGKMLIGARIVDSRTGEPPTLGQYMVRYAGYLLAALPLMLGFLWVGFDRKKQGWHDKLTRTMVVRVRREGELVRLRKATRWQ